MNKPTNIIKGKLLHKLVKSKLPKPKQAQEQTREKTLLEKLNASVIKDVKASFKIGHDGNGNETPESFVARADASSRMTSKLFLLSQIPNSGVTLLKGSLFGDEESKAYGEFLHQHYKNCKQAIADKEQQ